MSKSKKNKSQNKKNTKKGGAPTIRSSSGLIIHSDNTHATWTKSFEKLASIKKIF